MWPVMTTELGARLEQVSADWNEACLLPTHAVPESQMGAWVHRFGAARAFVVTGRRHPERYNVVLGVGDEHADLIGQIVELYRERGLPVRIDLAPGSLTERLALALARHGLCQTRFNVTLYGLPAQSTQPVPADVTIRQVQSEADLETLVDVAIAGFEGEPVSDAERSASIERFRSGRLRLYLAYIDGEAAAFGSLFTSDGIGYLAGGATRPEFRRRGCQTALIHVRISAAATLGCEIVMVTAAFGSTSQHNLERAGLRIAYTKAIWTELAVKD